MSKPCNPNSDKATQADTYICNPATGFWVRKDGATGKKILAKKAQQAKQAKKIENATSTESKTLQHACLGKSKSQGGMNVADMFKFAKKQGYTGKVNRADLTTFLCSKTSYAAAPEQHTVSSKESDTLQHACLGKSKSQGGMNVADMFKFAKKQGYTGKVNRADLTTFLCSKSARAKPAKQNLVLSAPKSKQSCPNGNKGRVVFSGDVLLAKEYLDKKTKKPLINPVGWWMSEKFDGYRSIWNGQSFVSRSGKPFVVPDWFSALMPPGIALDGEFWAGRECFEKCGIFRKKVPKTEDWINRRVVYKVFDLPASPKPFEARMAELKKIVEERCLCQLQLKLPHKIVTVRCPLEYTEHIKVHSKKQVDTLFREVIKGKGEGLMLRKAGSYYEQKRSSTLRKLKATFDIECKIIGYKSGTGKYEDKLGSFKCLLLNKKGRPFFVSGMSDQIRDNYKKTHPKGTIITIKYNDFSNDGTPRHPRYLRKRPDAGL